MVSETVLSGTASPAIVAAVAAVYLLLLGSGTLTALLLAREAARGRIPWDAHGRELGERALTWRDGLTVFGLVLVLLLSTGLVASLLDHPSPSALLLLQSIGLDALGLALLAWYLRHRGQEWSRLFGLRFSAFPRAARLGVLFYLAVLPLVFFSSMVYQGVLTANGYPPTLQDIALLLTADHPLWLRLYMLFMAVVLAPVFEECLFRGILLPLFARGFGIGTGIFLSSLLFAAIHFHMPSLVPLCVVATGFAIGYLFSGSLWVPVTMHALFNGVNLGLLLAIRQ